MLIKTRRGQEEKVADMVEQTPVVKLTDIITGPWDIIIMLEGEKEEEVFHNTIIEKICKAPDVIDTLTLTAIARHK